MNESSLAAKAIFNRASDLDTPEERQAYLDRACAHNAELRRRIEALLDAAEADRVQDNPSGKPEVTSDVVPGQWLDAGALPETPLEGVGSRIGSYKLLQQIGEGGMGVVFVAEQQEPLRRMVAVKVIKAGMDSAQVIARFEAERQALALMDHPHIARVLDAGTTQNGRPYFVMELVKGIPITRYCDEQRLSPRQRLQLFVPVCQAIQHAHQKGIIHRDIKPSNVLVAVYDGKPVPKVIDFGVAKAMGQKLTERTLFTGLGGIVGTLEYMSPEQAEFNALDIDTRSDVYALGVLLYELLTGTTPLMRQRLKDAALQEVLRLIREEEPPRPSTRLSELGRSGEPSRTGSAARLAAPTSSLASVSAQRHLEPAALVKALRGEVDWMVMKALEKERTRRYETANGLARDIQRYLADEPVEASPPSTSYRLRKLAWKHRRGLVMAAASLFLLIAGAVVSSCLAVWAVQERNHAREAEVEAKQQRDQAEAAEADTKAVLGFFQDKVLSAGRPKDQEGGLGNKVTLAEAVDAAEPAIVEAFVKRPLVEASIRDTLGLTYWYLGENPQAIQQHERALALREAQLGADHTDTLYSRNNLASAYDSAGRIEEAIRLHEQNLKLYEAKLGLDHPQTLESRNNLAATYYSAGRYTDAIRSHEQNLKLYEAKLGSNHRQTLNARNNLATTYYSAGRLADAIRLHEQNLQQLEATLGPDHLLTLTARQNLAVAYDDADRIEEAIRLHEQILKQREAKLGSNHPNTLHSRNNLAVAYLNAGRTADAILLYKQTLKQQEAKLGSAHPRTLIFRHNLAAAYDRAGEFAKAEPLHRAVLEQTRKRFGAEHTETAGEMASLGLNLLRQHKDAEAVPLLRDCLKIRETKQPDGWTTFNTQWLLGAALLGQKKYAEAEPLLLHGYQGMKQREAKIPPPGRVRLVEALGRLVQLYDAWGKKDQAEKWRKEHEGMLKARASDSAKK